MPSIRIRKPFAVAFVALLLASAYLGLWTQVIPSIGQSDKGLHFVCFFLLTLTFYWILETSRRRVVNLTLLVCTAGLSIGSEVVQALLPNGRIFDPYDILANVLGSGLALALCQWYHRRMLERRRQTKHYDLVPGEEGDAGADLELGEGPGLAGQETGTVDVAADGAQALPGAARGTNVTEELDQWDENEEDWEEDGAGSKAQPKADDDDAKKRSD